MSTNALSKMRLIEKSLKATAETNVSIVSNTKKVRVKNFYVTSEIH